MPLVAIVFHVMETSTAIFPRHGKYSSTVWKKQVEQPPALNVVAMITKDQTRVSEKKHNNALHRTAHKVRRTVKADVLRKYETGNAAGWGES